MPPQLPPQLTDAIGKRVLLLTPRYSSIGILGTLKLSNPQDNLSRFEFLMLPQWVYDSVLKLEKPRGFLANAENLPIGLIRLREEGVIYLGHRNDLHKVAASEAAILESLTIAHTDRGYEQLRNAIDKARLLPREGL